MSVFVLYQGNLEVTSASIQSIIESEVAFWNLEGVDENKSQYWSDFQFYIQSERRNETRIFIQAKMTDKNLDAGTQNYLKSQLLTIGSISIQELTNYRAFVNVILHRTEDDASAYMIRLTSAILDKVAGYEATAKWWADTENYSIDRVRAEAREIALDFGARAKYYRNKDAHTTPALTDAQAAPDEPTANQPSNAAQSPNAMLHLGTRKAGPPNALEAIRLTTDQKIALAILIVAILGCVGTYLAVPQVQTAIQTFLNGVMPTMTPISVTPTPTPR